MNNVYENARCIQDFQLEVIHIREGADSPHTKNQQILND